MASFEELRKIAQLMFGKKWGKVQNDNTDNKFPNGMRQIMKIDTYDDLVKTLENCKNLSPEDCEYFKVRWFRFQCAKKDEETFCLEGKASMNPNPYDPLWDVKFWDDNELIYDVKSTNFPKKLSDYKKYIDNPELLAKWFYKNQSQGVRKSYQNRLFVVHHGADDIRTDMLRVAFGSKKIIFSQYADYLKENGINTLELDDGTTVKWGIIIIDEDENKKVKGVFC